MITTIIILAILAGVVLYARNDFKNDKKTYGMLDKWNEINNPK